MVKLTAAQITAGVFYFHSCLRVRIDSVAGETVFGNQDGDREQENIGYFQVAPAGVKKAELRTVVMHNEDSVRTKDLVLGYRLTAPGQATDDWKVILNSDVHNVVLAPGEVREIPLEIVPGPSNHIAGQRYSVDVFSLANHELISDIDPADRHTEFRQNSGARIEGLIVVPSQVTCRVTRNGQGQILVEGRVDFSSDLAVRPTDVPIMAIGYTARGALESSSSLMRVNETGNFAGSIAENSGEAIEHVDCMFAGTSETASALTSARVP